MEPEPKKRKLVEIHETLVQNELKVETKEIRETKKTVEEFLWKNDHWICYVARVAGHRAEVVSWISDEKTLNIVNWVSEHIYYLSEPGIRSICAIVTSSKFAEILDSFRQLFNNEDYQGVNHVRIEKLASLESIVARSDRDVSLQTIFALIS